MATLNELFCNILGDNGSEDSHQLLVLKNKILTQQYQLNLFDYDQEDSDTLIEIDQNESSYPGTYYNSIIRRIYLKDGSYQCGWVVDSDVSACMSCGEDFILNIFGKHHCRACGNIVCSECSPYVADVQPLYEKGGSRICKDCFRTMLQDIDDALRQPNLNDSCLDFGAIYDVMTPNIGNIKSVEVQDVSRDDVLNLFQNSPAPLHSRQASYSVFKLNDENMTYEVNPLKSTMTKTASDEQHSIDRSQSQSTDSASHEKKEEEADSEPNSNANANANHALPDIEVIDDFGSSSEFNTPLPSRKALPPNFMRSSNGSISGRSIGSFLPRARFQFNQSFNSPTAAPKMVEEFKRLILAGDAAKARSLLRFGCEPPESAVSTKYLRTILKNYEILQDVLGTVEILVEQCGADYNDIDQDGVSILELVVLMDHDIVGDYLIAQGADCLRENSKGDCTLSVSFDLERAWVYQKFRCYQEQELLKSSKYDRIEVYIKCLIFVGHISRVTDFIESKLIFIGPEEAMDLYQQCLTTPDRMKDPDLTLDFLRRLGATIADDEDEAFIVDLNDQGKASDARGVEEAKGWEAVINVEGSLVKKEFPSPKADSANNKANAKESEDAGYQLEDDWSVVENNSVIGPVSIEDVTYI